MTKAMQNALERGTPEFHAYAEYVMDSIPDVTVSVLREMFKHNASAPDTLAHMKRIGEQK